ncbi:MAG: WYL domain-containing protein [Alphaproteobacteria bacterium]|nr:WYL domain-containing protein [Alphaproteobacteria bacterium]
MSYNKIGLLMDIVTRMQTSEEGVNLSKIMELYQVDKRTAIRYVKAIKEQFPQLIEIKGSGNRKSWRIPPETVNQHISVNFPELHSLERAIRLMKEKSPEDSENLDRLLNKIKAGMARPLLNKYEPDAEMIFESEKYAFRPGPKVRVDKKLMETLRTAILGCQAIIISYESKEARTEKLVWPYGFVYGNQPYLIAWNVKHSKMYTFNISRIKDVKVQDDYFTRDENFSLEEFMSQSFGIFHEEPFDVEWLFDKDVAKSASEYQFHPKQEMIHNDDGTLTVKFRAGGALEMDWHLYTWGNHVKVIKPENWDTMIKER